MMADDRAMSDLIAFTLIVSVMLVSIGLVATVGFGAIEEVRDVHAADSAQDGLLVVADQVTGIADHHAPARAAEIRLADATLVVTEASTVNVTVAYDTGENVTHSVQVRAFEYQAGDTTISVFGGAVIRHEDGGAVLIREPPWQCTDSQARINLITVAARGDRSVHGHGTIRIQTRHDRTTWREPANRSYLRNATAVTVSFEEDPPAAFVRHFEDDAHWTVTEDGFVCTPSEQRGIIVRSTTVSLDFTR